MTITVVRHISLNKDRILELLVQVVVRLRERLVVERCTVAVEHVAEDVGLAIGADHFCHTCHGAEGSISHVHITVLTHTVFLYQLRAIDMHVACYALLTHEDSEVLICHCVLGQMLAGEVQHHRGSVIGHHVESLTTILLTEAPPVVLIHGAVAYGQLIGRNIGNRVSHHHVGVSAHILTANRRVGTRSLTAGQVLHHD